MHLPVWRVIPRLASSSQVLPRVGPVCTLDPAIALKLGPPLHGNLAAIEFTFVLDTSLLCLFSCSLSSLTPREVIKLPECIGREDEIPYREREKVDEHPDHIRPAMRCYDNEDGWQTENQAQKDQRNDLGR